MATKLIVVADASKAHFVEGKGLKLQKITKEFTNTELGSKTPDDRHNGQMNGHFYDPPTPVKEVEKLSFACEVAHEVHREVLAKKYDSVILVAPAKMLGHMRKKMNGHCHIEKSLSLNAVGLDLRKLEGVVFS